MRHRVAHRKIGRVTEHRIAMLRSQAQALLRHERIQTTVPRAKELRPFVERIITIADANGDWYAANGHASCPNGTAVDCNDSNSNIRPNTTDTNCNGVDDNCSGAADEGYVPTATSCGVGECAATGQNIGQSGAVVNTCTPGGPQTESYTVPLSCSDNKDNDCDGLTDGGDISCNPPDVDNDGDGLSENNGDCDDTSNKVYPGAPRICDGEDNDCDGRLDFSTDVDNDHDGWPVCVMSGQTKGDCNDSTANINPGKRELYGTPLCSDGIDNDCDGKTDGQDPDCSDPCPDADHDGFSKFGKAQVCFVWVRPLRAS